MMTMIHLSKLLLSLLLSLDNVLAMTRPFVVVQVKKLQMKYYWQHVTNNTHYSTAKKSSSSE